MIGLRIGVGSLGLLCLSAALVMVLEQVGALSGLGGELMLVAVVVGVAGASLWMILQMAPVSEPVLARPVGKTAPVRQDMKPTALAERVRLLPQLPGGLSSPNGSWLGGHPKLPQGVDWPEIDGKPGHFLAQIDCASLPAGLWNGQGPRHGAMVFFRAQHPDSGTLPVRVMHVDGALSDAALPDGVERRPHWPLTVQQGGDTTAKRPPEEPNWTALHDVDLTQVAFQPFDAVSADLLRDHLQTLLDDLPRPDAGILEALAELGRAGRKEAVQKQEAGLFKEVNAMFAAHPHLAVSYFNAFERHCRCVYTQAPEDLPMAQRAVFEPFWTYSAHHESGSIGQGVAAGAAAKQAEEDSSALLLELPSSELLGWKFGKGRALRVYAPPQDLANGRFSRAWGSDAV